MQSRIYVLETFNRLLDKHKVYIISHKTNKTYFKSNYNLKNLSYKWLRENIIEKLSYKLQKNIKIFFEETIDRKIAKIKEMKCDVFIDDLEEVLIKLPLNMEKYLFDPKKIKTKSNLKCISNWNEIYFNEK